MHVIVGDNAVYGNVEGLVLGPGVPDTHVHELVLGGGPIPGTAGTVYEVVSINVYASSPGAPAPAMDSCLYQDQIGSPTAIIANSPIGMPPVPIPNPAWLTWNYVAPRPVVTAGQPYWFGIAVWGPAFSQGNIYHNGAGVRRWSTISTGGGGCPDPWGLFVAGVPPRDYSAYIVIDVPPVFNAATDIRPVEKYHRLRGRRGGFR